MIEYVEEVSHRPLQSATGGIRLNVYDESVTYMGVFPMATTDDKEIENFTVLKGICLLTGKPCKIKPFVWSKPSERVFKKGKQVLNMKSEFSCLENLDIRLTFSSNGQQLSKMAGSINKFRRKINWTPDNPWIEQYLLGVFETFTAGTMIVEGKELLETGELKTEAIGAAMITVGTISAIEGQRDYFSAIESYNNGKKTDILEVFFSDVGFTEKDTDSYVKAIDNIFSINSKVAIVLNIAKLKPEVRSEILKKMNRAERRALAYKLYGTRNLKETKLTIEEIDKAIISEKADVYISAIKDEVKGEFVSKEAFLKAAREKSIEYSSKKIDRLTGQQRFDLEIKYANDQGYVQVK